MPDDVQPCACAVCGEMLAPDLEPKDLAQAKVFKCGELHYISLAHRKCVMFKGLANWEYDPE